MTEEEIHRICKKYKITNYNINDDMSIDVDGDVNLYKKGLRELPLRLNKVSGYFNCAFNKLETLEGSPKEVGGGFYCYSNELKSLEGGPDKVSGNFNCTFNKLTSLKGAPLEIGGNFLFNDNRVDLDYNNYLKSVKRVNKLSKL